MCLLKSFGNVELKSEPVSNELKASDVLKNVGIWVTPHHHTDAKFTKRNKRTILDSKFIVQRLSVVASRQWGNDCLWGPQLHWIMTWWCDDILIWANDGGDGWRHHHCFFHYYYYLSSFYYYTSLAPPLLFLFFVSCFFYNNFWRLLLVITIMIILNMMVIFVTHFL